jgi:hypothetical protein
MSLALRCSAPACITPDPCTLPIPFPLIPGVIGAPAPVGGTITYSTGVSTVMLKVAGCVDTFVIRRDRTLSNNTLVTEYFNSDGTAYTGALTALVGTDSQVGITSRHHDFTGATTVTAATLNALVPYGCLHTVSFTVKSNAALATAVLTEGGASTSLTAVGEARDGIDSLGWSLSVPAGMVIVASWKFSN